MKNYSDSFYEDGYLDSSSWENCNYIIPKKYLCANCYKEVASERGWKYHSEIRSQSQIHSKDIYAYIHICPLCGFPTYFDYNDRQIPQGRKIISLENTPSQIKDIYFEMVSGYIHCNYTSCLLLGRKLLMHIAVAEFDAKLGQDFTEYVTFLKTKTEISSKLHDALDQIKKMGNAQNHKTIEKVEEEDADLVIKLVEGVLQNLYIYPKINNKK